MSDRANPWSQWNYSAPPPPPPAAPHVPEVAHESGYPPLLPTSHAAPHKSKRPLLISAAVVVLLALAGVGAWSLLGKATGPSKFTARGTFTVFGSYDYDLGASGVSHYGSVCEGADGYNDLGEGTQVRIAVKGEVVAYGEFGTGHYVGGNCLFHWRVDGVPAGKPRYSVEVNNRGNIFFQEKELRNGVQLEIGQNG
jgi:hypothetical protein